MLPSTKRYQQHGRTPTLRRWCTPLAGYIIRAIGAPMIGENRPRRGSSSLTRNVAHHHQPRLLYFFSLAPGAVSWLFPACWQVAPGSHASATACAQLGWSALRLACQHRWPCCVQLSKQRLLLPFLPLSGLSAACLAPKMVPPRPLLPHLAALHRPPPLHHHLHLPRRCCLLTPHPRPRHYQRCLPHRCHWLIHHHPRHLTRRRHLLHSLRWGRSLGNHPRLARSPPPPLILAVPGMAQLRLLVTEVRLACAAWSFPASPARCCAPQEACRPRCRCCSHLHTMWSLPLGSGFRIR